MLLLIFCIIIVILVTIACVRAFLPDKVMAKEWSLKDDGVVIMKQVLGQDQIDYLRNQCTSGNYKNVQDSLHHTDKLLKQIHAELGTDYEFQDYVWIIQKSSVHTCHRDNNGDFFNVGQKFPSYTILVYLEDMPSALGFIPKSHLQENRYTNMINITDPLVHIPCKKGDVIIFNANLIHVGTIDDSIDDHLRIQMKITHHLDRQTIGYYENYHKILNKDNTIPKYLRKVQKHVSCMAPLFSDYVQTDNIMSARGSDNGAHIGLGQQVFSQMYYGNTHFYDLPNAF
jgi:hypothetical protein